MSKSKIKVCQEKGFTLIELLVVIAIIAILAAILFPVFAKVRENAKTSQCAVHIKQLYLALENYAQDNNGKYPVNLNPVFKNKQWVYRNWDYALMPYVKNVKIYRCPAYGRDRLELANRQKLSQSTYGLNSNLIGNCQSNIVRPTRTVVLYDSDDDGQSRLIGQGHTCPYFHWGIFDYRHNDGDNFCLADGHVKWLPTRSLEKDKTTGIYTWEGYTFDPSYKRR